MPTGPVESVTTGYALYRPGLLNAPVDRSPALGVNVALPLGPSVMVYVPVQMVSTLLLLMSCKWSDNALLDSPVSGKIALSVVKACGCGRPSPAGTGLHMFRYLLYGLVFQVTLPSLVSQVVLPSLVSQVTLSSRVFHVACPSRVTQVARPSRVTHTTSGGVMSTNLHAISFVCSAPMVVSRNRLAISFN